MSVSHQIASVSDSLRVITSPGMQHTQHVSPGIISLAWSLSRNVFPANVRASALAGSGVFTGGIWGIDPPWSFFLLVNLIMSVSVRLGKLCFPTYISPLNKILNTPLLAGDGVRTVIGHLIDVCVFWPVGGISPQPVARERYVDVSAKFFFSPSRLIRSHVLSLPPTSAKSTISNDNIVINNMFPHPRLSA